MVSEPRSPSVTLPFIFMPPYLDLDLQDYQKKQSHVNFM